MKRSIELLAAEFIEDHRGIPDERTAVQLVESFFRVARKRLLKHGSLSLDGIGELNIVRFEGTTKRNKYSKALYETPPRNVVKFTAAYPMKKLANMVGQPDKPQ